MVSLKEVLILSVLVVAMVVSPADAVPTGLEKPGRCRRPEEYHSICPLRAISCNDDSRCSNGYKCCLVGCGKRCMPVAIWT
uniref:Single whey acidic protein domain-containing protein isoform 3 n=1 Tax=Penaeus monodon TaxID=6687 RepID=B6S2X5_PENMO|nr:single whey acidic protein domain-containing protein isoform 3 [Penaeus monodon]